MHGIKYSLWALNTAQIKTLLTKKNALINIGKYLPLSINGKTKLNIKFVFTTVNIVLVITISNPSVIIVIVIIYYYY